GPEEPDQLFFLDSRVRLAVGEDVRRHEREAVRPLPFDHAVSLDQGELRRAMAGTQAAAPGEADPPAAGAGGLGRETDLVLGSRLETQRLQVELVELGGPVPGILFGLDAPPVRLAGRAPADERRQVLPAHGSRELELCVRRIDRSGPDAAAVETQ